ncbi:MAG: lysine-2,3-aminomutase-like protein [Alphaproteobacteria bacterium]|nr:lysine-2,3-aminomutase-like protein [Alphaproteobacteria bacterium]
MTLRFSKQNLENITAAPRASTPEDAGENGLGIVTRRYAVGITDHLAEVIDGAGPDDPVALQYVPQVQELKILPEELVDPIGDEAHSPVKGIVHRYPDRVLFSPISICAVYCRYCFRREKVGKPEGVLKTAERKAALDYIRTHPEIWEVILTGGDPLVLSPRQLGEIMKALGEIEHVKIVRIHSRLPVADPVRAGEDMIAAMKKAGKAVYLAVHINHEREITDEVRTALLRLHGAGINLLSQSVLLRGVNDNADTLAALFRALVGLNVKPYYLHHPDLAPGTSHFRLSIAEGQEIMRALLGRLSGIALPTYMLDIPGGMGKIPLTPSYIEPFEGGGYSARDYKGRTHVYTPQIEKVRGHG